MNRALSRRLVHGRPRNLSIQTWFTRSVPSANRGYDPGSLWSPTRTRKAPINRIERLGGRTRARPGAYSECRRPRLRELGHGHPPAPTAKSDPTLHPTSVHRVVFIASRTFQGLPVHVTIRSESGNVGNLGETTTSAIRRRLRRFEIAGYHRLRGQSLQQQRGQPHGAIHVLRRDHTLPRERG